MSFLVFFCPRLFPQIEHTFAPLPFTSGWTGPRWDNWIAALKQIELSVHWTGLHCWMLDVQLSSTHHSLRQKKKGGVKRKREGGRKAAERCLCIIEKSQIGRACIRCAPALFPLSVRCWTHNFHKWMDRSMNYFVLCVSVVPLQNMRVTLRHHLPHLGRYLITDSFNLSVVQKIENLEMCYHSGFRVCFLISFLLSCAPKLLRASLMGWIFGI